MQFPDLTPHALLTLTKRGAGVIGEREARLLDAVDRVRSIKDAAAEAGISYRTAWSAIQQMEQALGRPIDDRLLVHIKAGVDQDRQAGSRSEPP